MAFQLSPGVLVTEKDLTLLVPAISTTAGGFVGAFQWGPVEEVTLIDSETVLEERFKGPNDTTFESYFTAANFLSYGNNLQVIRTVNRTGSATGTGAQNAFANITAGISSTNAGANIYIKNEDDYDGNYSSGETNRSWAAKYPGELGNALKVSMCDANTYATWEFVNQFPNEPGTSTFASTRNASNDEIHVAIVDETGAWTGTANTILEKFELVSKGSDALKADGSSNYYVNVINDTSKYVWWLGHTSNVEAVGTAWGSATLGSTFKTLNSGNGNINFSLGNAVSNDNITDGNITTALNIFKNDDLHDISLLPLGKASSTVAEHAISQIA